MLRHAPILAALAACSIPDTAFHATPDGAGGGDDMTDVLSIVVSKQAVALDEGMTADFTVKLNHAPASPLEVDLSTASRKIGLSMQKLFFDADNFAIEKTIMVTGVADDDTATEIADIKLTAQGVADVMVGATVRDNDTVAIVADIASGTMVTVGEGTSRDVHVHLSHRPPGDVQVTAMMSSGPITVSPAQQVFHMDDTFDDDVKFTLTAPIDPNVVNEMQTITFAIAGGDQKIFNVQDVDKDTLAISVSPTSITHLREGNSFTLNITLTKQPATAVTVDVATTTGQLTIDTPTPITFQATGNDYMVNHPVTFSAKQDANTTPESDTIKLSTTSAPNVTPINVGVQIDDDDVQEIQTTVLNSLTVTEGMSTPFGVKLRFAPTPGNPVTVNLSTADSAVATASSSTGANFLTFTDTDYADPAMHQVFVQGTNDNNLVTNSTIVKLISGTLETDVNVDVTDDDRQAFSLSSTAALSIPEGGVGSFTVKLAFLPTAPVHAVLSSSMQGPLPVTPAFIDFDATNWFMPVTVQVKPPIDSNNVSETATISVTAAPIPAVSVTATAVDATQIDMPGWPGGPPPLPAPFTGTFTVRPSGLFAYKIHIVTSNLDSFGIYVPNASSAFRMALYTDVGNKPGDLVGVQSAQFPITTLANGVTIVDIPDVPLTVGDYWLVLRVSANTNVGATPAAGATGRRCLADFDVVGLGNNWPTSFGSSTCADFNLLNIWTTTYHQ